MTMLTRRGLVAALAAAPSLAAAGLPKVTVAKDPTCGCCVGWAEHVRAAGFPVAVVETSELNRLKARLGVPRNLATCHTAEVDGYVIEGHVPARAIERLLAARPEVPGGNFRLVFDGDTGFDRWLAGFYALIRRGGLYYGDSGIFVRRRVLEAIGGVRPLALMEDYDLVRRLERAGPTACIADPPLVTSSRRFAGRRPPAIVWGWVRVHALYVLGAAPARLAEIYDSERRR